MEYLHELTNAHSDQFGIYGKVLLLIGNSESKDCYLQSSWN